MYSGLYYMVLIEYLQTDFEMNWSTKLWKFSAALVELYEQGGFRHAYYSHQLLTLIFNIRLVVNNNTSITFVNVGKYRRNLLWIIYNCENNNCSSKIRLLFWFCQNTWGVNQTKEIHYFHLVSSRKGWLVGYWNSALTCTLKSKVRNISYQ